MRPPDPSETKGCPPPPAARVEPALPVDCPNRTGGNVLRVPCLECVVRKGGAGSATQEDGHSCSCSWRARWRAAAAAGGQGHPALLSFQPTSKSLSNRLSRRRNRPRRAEASFYSKGRGCSFAAGRLATGQSPTGGRGRLWPRRQQQPLPLPPAAPQAAPPHEKQRSPGQGCGARDLELRLSLDAALGPCHPLEEDRGIWRCAGEHGTRALSHQARSESVQRHH